MSSIALILLFAAAVPAMAQFSSNVQGTVSDPTGAAVPQAKVRLLNTATGVALDTSTETSGFYRFTSVVTGPYRISVEASGFQATKSDFTLQTEETKGINITLPVAGANSSVTVSEVAPGINPDETRLVTTITGAQVPSLPLPQRSTLALLKLAPGVADTNPGNVISNISIGLQQPAISANGRDSSANLYRLDGIPVMSAQSKGSVNVIPAPDMLSETTLQTSSFSAETGSASSLITDFSSKSGVNDFHGDADLTYSSKTFEAHQWNSGAATPFTQKWLSGSLGGPVIKNRTFFFGSVESQYVANGGSGIDTYETDQFYNWAKTALPDSHFVSQFAAYRPTRDQFVQNLTYASQVYPANSSNGPACGHASSNFMPCDLPVTAQGFFTQSPTLNGTQYNIRLDHYLRNGNDRVFLNYFRVDQKSDFLSPRPAFDSSTPSTTNFLAANWVHTFSPAMINQAQFGWTRYHDAFGAVGKNAWIDTPFIMFECCDNLGFFGYFPPTIDPGGTNTKDHEYRFRDHVGWVKGNHSLRFGFEAAHLDYSIDSSATYARPFIVTYSNFWDLINDNPNGYQLYTISAQTGKFIPQVFGAQTTQIGLYAQDEWKIRPNLLISLGLRWDDYGNPYQYGDQSQPFVQAFPGASNVGTTPALQQALANSSYTRFVGNAFAGRQNGNFEPRLAAAWTPGWDRKTSIRAGFGLYQDALDLNQVTSNLPTQPPNRLTLILNSGNPHLPPPGKTPWGSSTTYPYGFNYPDITLNGFDNRGAPIASDGSIIPAGIGGVDRHLKPQQTGIWNIGIQREMPGRVVASVNYSGSYAWDLFSNVNYNLIPGNAVGLTSEWGQIHYLRNGFSSNYNALIVAARQNLGRLGWQSSYSWSHALSDQILGSDVANFRYATAPFDIRHHFSFGGTYEFPAPRNRFLKAVGGGWTVGSIVVAQTGTPFTVVSGNNYLGDADTCSPCGLPNIGSGLTKTGGYSRSQYENGLFPPNSFLTPAVANSQGNEGLNRFRNPGYLGFDASLVKKTILPWFGDRTSTLLLRFEAINALNRVNLQAVDATLEDANFGKSTAANLPRVLQLGARFQF